MKNYILYLLLILSPVSSLYSQNTIYVNGGYGIYLSNSENSTPVMGDETFRSYFNFGFSYQRDNLFGLNFVLQYNYNNTKKENTLTSIRTSADSPEPLGTFGTHVTLINHNIDLNYTDKIDNNFAYGIGPSFAITNRIVETDAIIMEEGQTKRVYDKLASSAIGANIFLSASIPLNAENSWFFVSQIKFRYTHSIWFDEGIRKLDDYNQDFVTAEINVGIGYSF